MNSQLLQRLILNFQRLAPPRGTSQLHGLLGSDELRLSIERERRRSDRTGEPFSLLVLSASQVGNQAAVLKRLAQILKRRLRLTDAPGWLDANRLGVVLPDTPAAGAWKVAGDIEELYGAAPPPYQCEIYTYPHPDSSLSETSLGESVRREELETDGVAARALDALLVQRLPAWKRALDVVVSSVALIVLLPAFALTALLIKLTSRGPVIFRQQRGGAGGKPFTIYKFRTMVVGAEQERDSLLSLNEQDGPAFKIKNDPRVTRLGRLLRATSIDELPQLWNVLIGDMSLVGPRPLPCDETAACRGWQRRRLDVTPGLTCIWQVWGRSQVTFAEWVRMDLRYIRSRSLALDLMLLVATIPALVSRKGAC